MVIEHHPWFAPESLLGVKLQGYPLESLLGVGGFGAVYKTRSVGGEPRAIKVLYPPRSSSADDMHIWDSRATHFLREAQTASRFSHPNIIRIYDSGQVHWNFKSDSPGSGLLRQPSAPLVYYVAEFLPDGIDRRLREGPPIATSEAIEILATICDALHALHNASPPVLHRDLNPGNVRLAPGRGAVLTDFGVARIEGLPTAYVTTEGPLVHKGVGAPEQFYGEEVNERTDIYQCGALLFVMLTGSFPRLSEPDYASVILARQQVPDRLSRTIVRCLETSREKRFPDAQSLRAALGIPSAPVVLESQSVSGPHGTRLAQSWTFRPEAACWRVRRAPVAAANQRCCAWDNRSLAGLVPGTGVVRWAWKAPEKIADSFYTPAVQAREGLIWARHGSSLTCLDEHGTPKWSQTRWSPGVGAFLAAQDLLLCESYAPTPGKRRRGVSALDAATGELRWSLESDPYHVVAMTLADSTLVVVETAGLLGSRGLRLRTFDAREGVLLAERNLQDFAGLGLRPGDAPLAALGVSDGTLCLHMRTGKGDVIRGLDLGLEEQWTISVGRDISAEGGFVLAGNQLILVGPLPSPSGEERGWMAGYDLKSGAQRWDRRLAERLLLPVMSADETCLFAMAVRPGHHKGTQLWTLRAMEPSTGQGSWTALERELDRTSWLSGPTVAGEWVYVQAPGEARTKGTKNDALLAGIITAYRRT